MSKYDTQDFQLPQEGFPIPQKEQPIDRYHQVEELYSFSPEERRRQQLQVQLDGKPPKKKKKKKIPLLLKILIAVGAVVVAVLLALLIAVFALFSRLNVEQVDTTSYVQTPVEVSAYDVLHSENVRNVLLIGADSNDDGSDGRADTMMLCSINKRTGELKLCSFLRDNYVEIPGYGKNRLNAAYAYGGAGLLMQTIENNFRINVDHYVETNFAGFENIINTLGGIDITMTAEEAQFLQDWAHLDTVAGENHLNGQEALFFARMRKLDSDFGRTTRQRQVINAVLQKMRHTNPITLYQAAYELMPNLKTNLSYTALISFLMAIAGMSEAESLSIPFEGGYTDYITPDGAMVLLPDFDQAIPTLQDFLYQ